MQVSYSRKDKEALEKNYKEAIKNKNFQNLVEHLNWPVEEVMKKTMKLQDTLEELERCHSCKGLYECKNAYQGHVSTPVSKDGERYFTYLPCKYKMDEVFAKKNKKSEEQVNNEARMKDVDVRDKKRVHVIKWIDSFFEKYNPSLNMKGLYLHGNFGCGKTFLTSALFHELQEKKNATTQIVYFPELLRELKTDWELYDYKMKQLMSVDLLLLDDIGAEKVSEWGRDEVLGTILQSRMNQNLATFFTSNLTMEELERHFILNEKKDEAIKARRIMERIKQLSVDMELISENRRG